LVLWQEDGVRLHRREATTFDPLAQCRRITRDLTWDRLAATGYGRKLYAQENPAEVVTEIQAYALGARSLFPQCRAIVDIGGQDTKAINLGEDGRVVKFEMNDRCAAGTGKFLEFMATGMGMSVDEFGSFALGGKGGIKINSMCTVFAESEATSLMARGLPAPDIALALHESVAKRSLAMLSRVNGNAPVVFAGGVARNPCMLRLVEQELGRDLMVPDEPDMVGALGAALFAARNGG
jgi:(R)-2-hydroxyacyl-CoA dehydratese activating ATPase